MIDRLGRRLRQRRRTSPTATSYPARWAAAAAAFRAALAPDGCARGSPTGRIRAQRFDLFLPEARAARGSWSTCTAATGGPSTAATGRISPAGRWRGAGRWRCPATCWRRRCGSPAITAMIGEAIAAAAAEVAGPMRLAGHSAGGHLVARQVCDDSRLPDGGAGAARAGGGDQRAARPAAVAAAGAERDAAARRRRGAAESPALRDAAAPACRCMPGSATASGRSSCGRRRCSPTSGPGSAPTWRRPSSRGGTIST